MSDPVLSARGIRKTFHENGQDLSILGSVDLDVSPGEVVAILGVSGSGKSTLLSIMGTLDKPDSGTLLIAGRDPSSLGDSDLSRLRSKTLGFVFQFHHLLPDLDALENVALPARIAGCEVLVEPGAGYSLSVDYYDGPEEDYLRPGMVGYTEPH